MEISDYIRQFRDESHIEVGDGLFSVHTNNRSEVINYKGTSIFKLSQEEYCINAKNGYFLICNVQTDKCYILDKSKQTKAIFSTYNLFVPKFRNIIVYYDSELNSIRVIDYAGKTLYTFDGEFVYSFESAHQISHDFVVLEFNPSFEDEMFNNCGFRKCIVINISNKEVVLQGKFADGYDETIISEVSYFELFTLIPNENAKDWNLGNIKEQKFLIPVIKYTVVEPTYDENDDVKYKQNVEFCDFCGNIVKHTEFSEISEGQNGYYIVKKDDLHGVIDMSFNSFLPCCFPKLIFEGNTIKKEEPHWSDWLNMELDFSNRRLIAKKKNGESILLPYGYCSCDSKYISSTNDILFAYKYNKNGERCTGIINTNGEELVTAQYKEIRQFYEYLYEALEFGKDDTTLIYIRENNLIIRNTYLKIEDCYLISDYYRVRVYDKSNYTHIKLGIIDSNGVEIIPPIYDYVFFPMDGKVTYIRNGLAGWINLSDMSTHEYPTYSVIRPFINGIAVVCTGYAKIYMASVDAEFEEWDEESHSLHCKMCESNNVYDDVFINYDGTIHHEGVIDVNGNIIIEPMYEKIVRNEHSENLLIVKHKGYWGAVDNKGNIIIPIQYKGYNTNVENDTEDYDNVVCKFYYGDNIDFYDNDGELLGAEDVDEYEQRHQRYSRDDRYDNQDYDYERDTYYALGGDDYDEWRANGGNLDDMMDGMGF